MTSHHDLMTRAEAAQALRLTPRTIDRWIRAGRLSASRVGRQVRIDAAQVRALCVPIAAPPRA